MEYLNQRYRIQQERDLLQTVQEMESAVTHLRQFAATALRVSAMGAMAESNATTIASVKLTQEGWLVISLPVMLPHRGEKDPARFLDEPLRTAIRDFFGTSPFQNSGTVCWFMNRSMTQRIHAAKSPTMTIWN